MSTPLSARNPKVEQVRLLNRERQAREETGLAVLEGIRLAEEALTAGVRLEYVLHSPELAERERGAALLSELRARRTPLFAVSASTLERAADTRSPQGLIAVFQMARSTPEDVGPGLVLLLEGLQDPGNLGTAIRSAEAFGAAGILLCGGVDPYNPKVIRGAMGSLFRLPVIRAELGPAMEAMRAQGRRILMADATAGSLPWQTDLTGSMLLIIGNEGAGPSPEARAMADELVCIPMPGLTESLNAGVAASLLLFEALRQRSILCKPAPCPA